MVFKPKIPPIDFDDTRARQNAERARLLRLALRRRQLGRSDLVQSEPDNRRPDQGAQV